MRHLYNSPELKERRKELRNNSTPEEIILWNELRYKKLGHKFVRQYGVLHYILDFYCPRKRLAIELDGSQHNLEENKAHDNARTSFLKKQNIEVLRFPNHEIRNDLTNVCLKINHRLNNK